MVFFSFTDGKASCNSSGNERMRELNEKKRMAYKSCRSIAEQQRQQPRTCVHGGGEYKVLFSKFMIVNKF